MMEVTSQKEESNMTNFHNYMLYSHLLKARIYILQSCNSVKYILCMNMVSFRFSHAATDMEFLSCQLFP